MARVSAHINNFRQGITGKVGQHSFDAGTSLQDAENVRIERNGQIVPLPGSVEAEQGITVLPADKILAFRWNGETFVIVYDTLLKRKFVSFEEGTDEYLRHQSHYMDFTVNNVRMEKFDAFRLGPLARATNAFTNYGDDAGVDTNPRLGSSNAVDDGGIYTNSGGFIPPPLASKASGNIVTDVTRLNLLAPQEELERYRVPFNTLPFGLPGFLDTYSPEQEQLYAYYIALRNYMLTVNWAIANETTQVMSSFDPDEAGLRERDVERYRESFYRSQVMHPYTNSLFKSIADLSFSRTRLRKTRHNATLDSMSNTKYPSLQKVHIDLFNDSFWYQRFLIYNSKGELVSSRVYRPNIVDEDSGEERKDYDLPFVKPYTQNPFVREQGLFSLDEDWSDIRNKAWGTNDETYDISQGADNVTLFNKDGVLPLLYLIPKLLRDGRQSFDVVDPRANYRDGTAYLNQGIDEYANCIECESYLTPEEREKYKALYPITELNYLSSVSNDKNASYRGNDDGGGPTTLHAAFLDYTSGTNGTTSIYHEDNLEIYFKWLGVFRVGGDYWSRGLRPASTSSQALISAINELTPNSNPGRDFVVTAGNLFYVFANFFSMIHAARDGTAAGRVVSPSNQLIPLFQGKRLYGARTFKVPYLDFTRSLMAVPFLPWSQAETGHTATPYESSQTLRNDIPQGLREGTLESLNYIKHPFFLFENQSAEVLKRSEITPVDVVESTPWFISEGTAWAYCSLGRNANIFNIAGAQQWYASANMLFCLHEGDVVMEQVNRVAWVGNNASLNTDRWFQPLGWDANNAFLGNFSYTGPNKLTFASITRIGAPGTDEKLDLYLSGMRSETGARIAQQTDGAYGDLRKVGWFFFQGPLVETIAQTAGNGGVRSSSNPTAADSPPLLPSRDGENLKLYYLNGFNRSQGYYSSSTHIFSKQIVVGGGPKINALVFSRSVEPRNFFDIYDVFVKTVLGGATPASLDDPRARQRGGSQILTNAGGHRIEFAANINNNLVVGLTEGSITFNSLNIETIDEGVIDETSFNTKERPYHILRNIYYLSADRRHLFYRRESEEYRGELYVSVTKNLFSDWILGKAAISDVLVDRVSGVIYLVIGSDIFMGTVVSADDVVGWTRLNVGHEGARVAHDGENLFFTVDGRLRRFDLASDSPYNLPILPNFTLCEGYVYGAQADLEGINFAELRQSNIKNGSILGRGEFVQMDKTGRAVSTVQNTFNSINDLTGGKLVRIGMKGDNPVVTGLIFDVIK